MTITIYEYIARDGGATPEYRLGYRKEDVQQYMIAPTTVELPAGYRYVLDDNGAMISNAAGDEVGLVDECHKPVIRDYGNKIPMKVVNKVYATLTQREAYDQIARKTFADYVSYPQGLISADERQQYIDSILDVMYAPQGENHYHMADMFSDFAKDYDDPENDLLYEIGKVRKWRRANYWVYRPSSTADTRPA